MRNPPLPVLQRWMPLNHPVNSTNGNLFAGRLIALPDIISTGAHHAFRLFRLTFHHTPKHLYFSSGSFADLWHKLYADRY